MGVPTSFSTYFADFLLDPYIISAGEDLSLIESAFTNDTESV